MTRRHRDVIFALESGTIFVHGGTVEMTENGPKEPSRPTTKRLFAVSGNRCAFPKCSTPLIDPATGSVVGEICHVCGDKPGAARYDATQTNEQRQGFDNLILLCNIHHKIVDDDEVAYSVDRLKQLKSDHEARAAQSPQVDDATAERFVTVVINQVHGGSVVTSHGQIGGQTAHVIHNHYAAPPADETVQVIGKLEFASGLEVIQTTGCFGLQLLVICRSNRPAKVRAAHLLIKGHGFIRSLQQGFSGDFGYTPLDDEPETFVVELFRLTPPNAHEGYVLNRDDVCRFFYPLPFPSTLLALQAKAEDVSIAIQFFDGEEKVLLSGSEIQPILKSLYEMYRERAGTVRVEIKTEVRAKSKTPPKADNVFRTNAKGITMVPQDQANSDETAQAAGTVDSAQPTSIDHGLKPLAIEILQAAQETGLVRETRTDQGGYLIRSGSAAFHNGDSGAAMARRRAELQDALRQLVMGRYIESLGGQGGTTYQLTSRGYELCDELKKQS